MRDRVSTSELRKRYIKTAIDLYGSNDIEFDPVSSCMIAEADGGAFVQAWVWVCQEDLEEQSC